MTAASILSRTSSATGSPGAWVSTNSAKESAQALKAASAAASRARRCSNCARLPASSSSSRYANVSEVKSSVMALRKLAELEQPAPQVILDVPQRGLHSQRYLGLGATREESQVQRRALRHGKMRKMQIQEVPSVRHAERDRVRGGRLDPHGFERRLPARALPHAVDCGTSRD